MLNLMIKATTMITINKLIMTMTRRRMVMTMMTTTTAMMIAD